MDLAHQLESGAAVLGVPLVASARDRLLQYVELLRRWNRVYNLTAVTAPADIVSRHLLDSLAAEPYVVGGSLIDLGSGAGLPGIPLAVARPDLAVSLLDSRNKRVRFLVHAIEVLGLDNVTVVHARVEQYRPERKFDTLISRAFAAIADLLAAAGHLCSPHGRILALKGAYPSDEIAQLGSSGFAVVDVPRVVVPGVDAERHIAILQPTRGTTVRSEAEH